MSRPSICASFYTESTVPGTVWGPGTLAGRAILALGEATLRSLDRIVDREARAIQKRFEAIRASIPHLTSEMYSDLRPVHSVAKIASTLPLLPQLTHLAFNDEDLITICPQILEECALLTVLVSRNAGRGRAESLFQEYAKRLSGDVRFVLIHSWWFEDWQLGVHSGLDYWARAEDFIAKRRSGEIPATQYELRGLDYWLG
ncbi:hypothetical protein C8R46DRAFT_1346932 [Mycena filopes]|nr:hypothetical protein C8R46DRAFT_1346932 [Mycena filopes]